VQSWVSVHIAAGNSSPSGRSTVGIELKTPQKSPQSWDTFSPQHVHPIRRTPTGDWWPLTQRPGGDDMS
jgi:hypothetical protein